MKKFTLAFLFLASSLQAQEIDFSGSVNLQGILSSESDSPFWFHSNKRGRIDEKTSFAGWANAAGKYHFSPKAFVEVGAGVLYHNGFTDKVQAVEYYLNFQYDWFSATVGRKQRDELYQGLSATNENMLWSLNSRPMPGIQFTTTRPVMFWKSAGLGFKATLEEYLMDDERYIEDARVHHKSFHLVFNKIRNTEVSFGLQHFAQWAGTSDEYGDLPGGFDDYLRVVTGKGISGNAEDGVSEQEINGLGNHLGSYEIQLKTIINDYSVELLWNHIFEDGSGSRLGNTPDGRYGIYISDPRGNQLVDALMYEFYYTKDQSSGSSTTDGTDNYFNNHLYRSGWTYESRVLGVPFFTLNENRFRIGNNRFIVHHIGLTGNIIENLPYKLLASYRKNYGGKGAGYAETQNIMSAYLDLQLMQNYVDLNVQVGGDFTSDASPNYGVGLRLSKDLF